MRNRAFAAIVALLLLPGSMNAQRRGIPGLSGRGRPAPLPPTAPAIAREMVQYRRLAISVESYPLVNFVDAPGFFSPGVRSHWTSYGIGTRASYRLKPYLSATLDLTSSPFGGLLTTQTAELGTRLLPERWDHKAHPFVDLRVGYMFAYQGYSTSLNSSLVTPPLQQNGTRQSGYSQGFGGIAGAGVEYSLTRTLMLAAGTSVMRNHMSTHRISAGATGAGSDGYVMTSYRVTLGLRYNPVRAMQSPAITTP